MYIVRDIFHIKFGHYKDVKALLDEAYKANMFPTQMVNRMLTDFTGDSYRLIMEAGFETLAEYEKSMASGMATPDWQKWYGRFREYAVSSHREILKEIKW